jgi:hypothetical protein
LLTLLHICCRWTQCHLSGEPLTPPCVIDELGTLYNKDAVVSALLSKTMPEPMSSYITGLKSVVEMRLERNTHARKWVHGSTACLAAGSATTGYCSNPAVLLLCQCRSAPKPAEKGLHQPSNESDFCCPITGHEFNGRWVLTTWQTCSTPVCGWLYQLSVMANS